MRLQAVTFGANQGLVGVLTEPAIASPAPHVLMLNAGVVHRVGPGGLYAELARRLADAGVASLRYDASGLGDSPARVPPLEPLVSAVTDAREAMDHLGAEHGARRFVVLGLCSGARLAHAAAVADPRIVGAVCIDGAVYPTVRSSLGALGALGERLRRPRSLAAGALRRVRARLGAAAPSPAVEAAAAEIFFPAIPPREQMSRELRALGARKVELLYAYSGEWRGFRYEGQLRDAFPRAGLEAVLTEKRIGSADHLFSTRAERSALFAIVEGWLQARFAER